MNENNFDYLPIIGISGKKHSGKDTVAEIIQKLVPDKFKKVSFALAVKQEIAKVTEVSLDEVEENKEVFRPILQWWGTEFRKKFQKQPKYWIDNLAWTITYWRETGYSTIISDVRFPEEAEYVKNCGGVLLRIERKNNLITLDQHLSEIALDSYPFENIIQNDGTIQELEEKVKKFLLEIKVI